jgi:tRNA-dihydrouridine synthase B
MFFHNLTTPVISLAPMDGVTDAAYRFIAKKYGDPDLTFTEFTNVIGLCRGADRLFLDFDYHDIERPAIAQVFGNDPEYFYHAAKIVVALGFDGIDINMGCPARNVAEKGSGAGLIRFPQVAKEIVRLVKKGVADYFQDLELTGVAENVPGLIVEANAKRAEFDHEKQKASFTVSVKTRVGYDSVIIDEWIKHLTEVEPDWITVHGRTLKQLYSGQADWDAIATAVENTHIPVFANGDITNANTAVDVLKHTKAQGVMIGRGSYGNPWIFRAKDQIKELKNPVSDYIPSHEEKIQAILEHTQLHWDLKGEKAFVQMRKNLAWYINSIPNASALRIQLMQAPNPEAVRHLIYSEFN